MVIIANKADHYRRLPMAQKKNYKPKPELEQVDIEAEKIAEWEKREKARFAGYLKEFAMKETP